ncbi:MAG TPA: ABC transporter permease [Bryobacteraceae bacterium]|jgi:predicted permease|nr:ABC transporter permease [Bryobacteraceae bacterium]
MYFADLRQDTRHGLRVLAGSPGFTFVALFSLTLGIAIATSAYSEMNGMILRDLPAVPNPDQLVALQLPASYPSYKRYRELTGVFSSTLAYLAPVPFSVSINGHTERTWGHLVTPSYFSTLGVRPALGRLFDSTQEQSPAVVVSYRFWQNHLASDPSIAGETLRVNGYPCVVTGVGPKDFLGASPVLFAADLWMPLSTDANIAPELAGNALERHDLNMFQMAGRLNPGITVDHAEAELNAVADQLAQAERFQADRTEQRRRVTLLSAGKMLPIRKQDLPFFKEFLMVMAGLVMLIACSNVANMMLAKAAGRRREIAVRLALGASRARLIRQLMTESMLVAVAAGVLGFILSAWLMRWASHMTMPLPIPVSFDMNPDARVLIFTVALTVFTGLVFGLAPALETTQTDLGPALKQGGNIQLRRHRRWSLRNGLVLCQMAASLMLLLITGYMGLGIQSSLGFQQGFNPRNLYLVAVDPIRDGYTGAQATAFFEKLLDRVRRLPAVTAASLTDTVPVAMSGNAGVTVSMAGKSTGDALRHIVGEGYFETAGIPILLGREFRKQDTADCVIVSQEFVRRYGTGREVLGQSIEIGNGEVAPSLGALPGTFDLRPEILGKGRRSYQVVGVVQDLAEDFVAQKKHPVIYFPLRVADFARPSLRGVTLMLRAMQGVDAIGAVRREISSIDPALTPFDARSMQEQIDEFMSPLRAASWTYGLIGAFGLILASVGLAGVTAYAVSQRGREIGIRVALGAQKSDVLALVITEGVVLVTVGTAVGLAAAWAGIRVLSGIFFTVASIESSDPLLLVGAPLLLASLALLACYLPARKSLEIDPAVALRQE